MSDLVLEWLDACMKVFGADEGDFGLMNEDSIIKAEKQYRSLIAAKEKVENELFDCRELLRGLRIENWKLRRALESKT